MDLKKLGSIIRNKRVEIGIPPSILAAKLEISRPTLWVWERGENPRTGKPSRPSKHALERLTEVLHMSQAELEEILTLAGYQVSTKPTQTPNQVSATIQTGTIHQHQSSSPVTITEINGTVYFAYDGNLEAFDAKSGNRLWFTSTCVPPLEPAQALVSGHIEAAKTATPLNTLESTQEDFQKSVEAAIRDFRELERTKIEGGITRPSAGISEPQASEVALEDLPPLEYSELQAANRRRRHRRSDSAKPPIPELNNETPAFLPRQNQSHQASKEREGLLFVLSGIDGSENDSVLTELKRQGVNIFVSPIHTTRHPYEGERQGSRHSFISEEDFKDYIAKGMFLSYLYNDMRPHKPPAWYGHERAPIIQSLRMGQDVIMDAGPEEAVQLRRTIPDAILILLRPSRDINTQEEHRRWEKRLQQINHNYTVNYKSHQLEEAANDLHAIILAEHEKARERQEEEEESTIPEHSAN